MKKNSEVDVTFTCLNPTENLWRVLKYEIAIRKPENISELEAMAEEPSSKIPQERCQKLVTSYA